MSYLILHNGQLVGTEPFAALTAELAVRYPLATGVETTSLETWSSNGTVWVPGGAKPVMLVNRPFGADYTLALAAMRTGSAANTSGTGVCAVDSLGAQAVEIHLEAALTAGHLIVVGWSETAGTVAAVNTQVEAYITAAGVAAASRTGLGTASGVRILSALGQALRIEATSGQSIQSMVLKCTAAADYKVTIHAETEPVA